MKTISAHTEAAIDSPYVDVIRLIEITIGSITLYFCDRVFGDDDLCTFNGQLYEPLIASWGEIAMGRINPVTYEPEPGSASFSVINSQPVGGVDSFSELFAADDPQYCPVLISEIHAGASNADDKEDIFKGGIEDLPGMTVDLVSVSCTGYELTIANKFIHTIVDDTTYPGADPDDLGKMVPQIYGTVKRSPCIAADVGGISTVAQGLTATNPANGTNLQISDGSAFPISGAFTVQVDDEQIRIASRSGNTLALASSGARGYSSTTAVAHGLGTPVIEIQAAYVYLIADHPVYDLDVLYVDDIRQPLGAQPDDETKLLLHMKGVGASTIFFDDGSNDPSHTVTANGNAQIDTAQKVFSTGSGLFDGTGDYLSVPLHLDWEIDPWSLAGGYDRHDFTIDFRVRFNTYAGKSSGLFHHCSDYNAGYWFLYYNSGATGKLRFYTPGPAIIIDADWISNPSGWYHIALVRTGNTFYIFVDGVQKGTATNACNLTGDGAFAIGRSLKETDQYPTEYYSLDGWIDEFRVSKGSARWTTAFNLPTVEYPFVGTGGGASPVSINLYTGQTGDEYAGYAGKAVAVFDVLPAFAKQINIDIVDDGHDHGDTTGYADIQIAGNSTAETVIGKQVSIDGQGYIDDSTGTYTGTPSALIERPDHISKHVIIVCCGLTASEIDTTSYAAAGTFFNTSSFTLSFVILQRPNVRKLLHRIASQAKAMQFWGAGKHHISPIETSPAVDKAIDDNRVDLGQISLKYTDRINIKNKFTARYSRQWSGHVDAVEADRAIVIASDATSIATFGTLQGDPESYPYVNDETQAQAVLNWKLSDSKASRLIAEPAGGYYLSDIERGDIIRFDNMEIVGETLTTGYLLTLGGDNLATLSGDQLIWWLSESAGGDEYLKKALIALVTMGTTLFRVIDKKYRPASTVQIEAVKI